MPSDLAMGLQIGEKYGIFSAWGLIDAAGREIIAPRYDRINALGDGLLAVGTDVEILLPTP